MAEDPEKFKAMLEAQKAQEEKKIEPVVETGKKPDGKVDPKKASAVV